MGGDAGLVQLFECWQGARGQLLSNHYSPTTAPEIQQFVAPTRRITARDAGRPGGARVDAARVAITPSPRERHGQDRGARRDRQTKDFPGSRHITIDEKRNAKKPAVVLEIKDGKLKFAAR